MFGLFRFVEKCYELFSSDFEEEFVVDRERNRETLEGLAIPLAIRSVEGKRLAITIGWTANERRYV